MDLYLASSMSSPKPGTLDTLFLISAYTNASKNFNVSLYIKSEKAMAPHSRTLAWKIPWTEETGGLQSMRSQRVRHNLVTKQLKSMCSERKRVKWIKESL